VWFVEVCCGEREWGVCLLDIVLGFEMPDRKLAVSKIGLGRFG
jgi:hypothetical protein